MTDEEKLALAAEFAAASRGNDGEAYAALFAPGAVTWHNFDGVEVTTEQTVRTIDRLHRIVSGLAWHDVALLPTPTGWVSQTIMTGDAPGGPLRVHSCVVVTLDDNGRITRVDEYLDAAQTAPLRG